MAYTKFTNVQSGITTGSVKGLLPLDENGASAFAYRKKLEVGLFGSFPDSFTRDLTSNWMVRVRDSNLKDEAGNYLGAVLFEQSVELTARVIAIPQGFGFSEVSWQTLGDAGSGRQQTSSVNGAARAVIVNINDPQEGELEAYGTNGAWRDLDSNAVRASATPEQKFGAEKGFTLLDDSSTLVFGGYKFTGYWQSAYYKIEIPEGAILETVFDEWQNGVNNTEAQYTVSWRPGSPDNEASLFDEKIGQQFRCFVKRTETGAATVVLRSRRLASPLKPEQAEYSSGGSGDHVSGLVVAQALRGLQIGYGAGASLYVLGSANNGSQQMKLFISTTSGESWEQIMDEPLDIVALAACLSGDKSRYVIYGLNVSRVPSYAVLKNGSGGWKVASSGACTGPNLPTKNVSGLHERGGGGFELMTRDAQSGEMRVLLTLDDGRTYKEGGG